MGGSERRGALRRFWRNRLAVVGAGLMAILILAALAGPLFYRVGYAEQFPGQESAAPSAAHRPRSSRASRLSTSTRHTTENRPGKRRMDSMR